MTYNPVKRKISKQPNYDYPYPDGCTVTKQHTALITEYNEKSDKFIITNVGKPHSFVPFDYCLFDEWDGQKWDSCYIVTTQALKYIGAPKCLE